MPDFTEMLPTNAGKHRGFMVGPGKSRKSWDKAPAKASGGVHLWQLGPLGLFFSTQTWKTFVAYAVGFVTQPYIEEIMAKLLRKAAYGPRQMA